MNAAELEEGELSSSDDEVAEEVRALAKSQSDDYENLERPQEAVVREQVIVYTDDEESDDEPVRKINRKALNNINDKPNNEAFQRAAQSFAKEHKENKIWSNIPLQDELAANFLGCDVSRDQHDRFVENYPFPQPNPNKMELDRNRPRPKHKKRIRQQRSKAVTLEVLGDIESLADEELGKLLAENLKEPKLELMISVAKTLSREKIRELYNWTRDIEEVGGMKTQDNRRRRSAGGTFLSFLKTDDQIPKKTRNYLIYRSNPGNADIQKRRKRRKRRNERKPFSIKMEQDEPEKSVSGEMEQKGLEKELPSRIELETKNLTEAEENGSLNFIHSSPEISDESESEYKKEELSSTSHS